MSGRKRLQWFGSIPGFLKILGNPKHDVSEGFPSDVQKFLFSPGFFTGPGPFPPTVVLPRLPGIVRNRVVPQNFLGPADELINFREFFYEHITPHCTTLAGFCEGATALALVTTALGSASFAGSGKIKI